MTNTSSQRRALVVQSNFSPFGNKLVQSGYVSPDQMQQAQNQSRQEKRPLTEVLEAITGKPLPPELQRQYKKQQLFELKILYGVEAFDPELIQIGVPQIEQMLETLSLTMDNCRRLPQ